MKSILRDTLIMILVLGLMASGFAQTSKEAQKELSEENIISSVTKEVEGTISWIGKDKIAVAYNKDNAGTEYEILLPFDTKNLVFEHKKGIGEIAVGDTVRVQFEENSIEHEDGRKEGKLKAKVISFVRPAPPKKQAATSSEEEPLPFKGIE